MLKMITQIIYQGLYICFALCDLVTYILLLKFVEEVVSTMLNLSCRTMSKGLLKLDAIVAAMLIYLSYNSNLVCI
jgi:hypothetical protein